jgi:hypothetical protein
MAFKKFTLITEDVDITQMSGATQSEETTETEETTEVTDVTDGATTETEQTSEQSVPAKFFSKLFESREIAHIFHLQAKGDEGSHASHLALQTYYEGVIELIDELVEVYQGQYEVVEGYENLDLKELATDKIQYFISLAEFIKTTRHSALSEEDTHLQSIVDDILISIYKTLYKLRFNK